MGNPLITAEELQHNLQQTVLFDCRFFLQDPKLGEQAYSQGHIPTARYAHLERDMSAPVQEHGGRHPLPDPQQFAEWLGSQGVGIDTPVVTYDDSHLAYASRLWWMMQALGYSLVQVLDGGLDAWRALRGELDTRAVTPVAVTPANVKGYTNCLDIQALRESMNRPMVLIDSREEKRYQGLEEPIDPIAGHIPGAVNYPWASVTDERGACLGAEAQLERWQQLELERDIVVYCGSGVTACVNLLSLSIAGRQASLYAGSWSDWCSYIDRTKD